MNLPEQPPPGPDHIEETPPAGWNGLTKRSNWNWGMWVVCFVVMIVLAGLMSPRILRSPKAVNRTQAISNAKQVGLALIEFDADFGSFPDESTVDLVKDSTGTSIDLTGSSANAMFRQLIAHQASKGRTNEDIYYVLHKSIPTHKPDNDISPGKALEPGEVGFSYFAGLSSSMNSEMPVLAAPALPGSDQFDDKPFKGKAVILRLDNSASPLTIRTSDKRVTVGGGKTLMDTGPHTVWGKLHTPDLRHPER